MIKMGDYEMRSIRCHPKCMTPAERDARMRSHVSLCVCGVVVLWNENVYLMNSVCVCHVVILQEGPSAHDT